MLAFRGQVVKVSPHKVIYGKDNQMGHILDKTESKWKEVLQRMFPDGDGSEFEIYCSSTYRGADGTTLPYIT